MRQTERLYLIDRILRGQGFATFSDLLAQLEVSRATLKRDLAFMRDRLNVPIVFDRDKGGYRLNHQAIGPRHELPGLWFDDDELLALLSINRLLDDLDIGGMLGPRLKPLVDRLQSLLGEKFGEGAQLADQLSQRVRFVRMHDRLLAPQHFALVARALLDRRRLTICHFSRSRNARTEREISPQRLVHYRNAWYLDAWCHLRNELRVFSLDATESIAMSDRAAVNVPDDELDAQVNAGYGIFAGSKTEHATLRFEAPAARWVRSERWHPRQELTELPDGRLLLTLPYSNSTELEMDILRHAEMVTVLSPPELAKKIRNRLLVAHQKYASDAEPESPAEHRPDAASD